MTHAGVREHSYWYDSKNRLTNVINTGGATVVGLGYDPQGNLSDKNGQQYGFDYGNRLRWVMDKENYRYDALGRRVETAQDDGTLRLFQYSQAGQYMFGWKKTPAGAETTQENVYLGGSVVATVEHNWPSNTVIATKYQHTDALGSPVATTDASGALIERTNYEPYGSAINKTVDGIGYTGHVMDAATGLTYMQQRYYDPTLGRFLSVDPVTADGSTGGNFNRYWYANNNPYRFSDPDGRFGCDTTGKVVRCAPIHGNAQKSSNTPTHGSTSQRIANAEAAKPGTQSVHMNQSLRTVTGDKNSPNIRPDVTVVNKSGAIDMHEVRSTGQTVGELTSKLTDARAGLGVAGKNIVVEPDAVPRGSSGSTVRGLGALGVIQIIFHEWASQEGARREAEARRTMKFGDDTWSKCAAAGECL